MTKQKIVYSDSLEEGLKAFSKYLKDQKVILFSGNKSFDYFKEKVLNHFNVSSHIKVLQSNPKKESIEKALGEVFVDENCLVIAIGGGSVLDTAKIVSFLSCNGLDFGSYTGYESSVKMPKTFFIPTTCGTGSESTQFATYYTDKRKHSLDCEKILPEMVLLTPEVLENLPPVVKGCTLADALSQAIESIWSVRSTEYSIELAVGAIQLLTVAINTGSLSAAIKGSNKSGCAIQISRTTAAHAISYSLTSLLNLPHGQAVSLTIPEFLSFNSLGMGKCNDPRGEGFVRSSLKKIYMAFGCKGFEDTRETILKLYTKLGLSLNFQDLGISRKDLDMVLEAGVNVDRLRNNPWEVTSLDVEKILIGLL